MKNCKSNSYAVEFWGYLHVNGSLVVKRALWTYDKDIDDARTSSFVKEVFEKIPATSREEATAKFIERIQCKRN